MQPDIEAKNLLIGNSCNNCEWQCDVGKTMCIKADKHSEYLTEPVECPSEMMCSDWERGYQNEWMENAMQGGSSIGIMDEKGKPTFYDATGASNIEIGGNGVYIDGRKIQ